MTKHIFVNILFLLFGYCCVGQAHARSYCSFITSFTPADNGNASKVKINDEGQLEVTTSDKNTLTNFTVWMKTDVQLLTAYRGGDSCFLSPMATGYSHDQGNLRFTTLSETRTGCGVWIGIPDGRVDYKGHATNFNCPWGGAFVYEIWGCVGTVTLKMKVSVIDPSKSFRTNYQKGQLFVPNSILKVSSGQVSRDLNGFYSSTISQNLLVKSPDCMVKLSAKASSGKAGVTVR